MKTLPNSISVRLVVIRGQQNNGKVQFFSKCFFPRCARFRSHMAVFRGPHANPIAAGGQVSIGRNLIRPFLTRGTRLTACNDRVQRASKAQTHTKNTSSDMKMLRNDSFMHKVSTNVLNHLRPFAYFMYNEYCKYSLFRRSRNSSL